MGVNGFLTLASVAGMLIERTSAHGTVLGLSNVRFVNPVFAGGTIYTECEVMGARKSENRKANEIVSVRTWYSQRGEKVVEFDRDFMVRERGAVWGSATGARAKRGRPR